MTILNERSVPLYGLVMAGGRSLRMQADKAAMNYHGRPQSEVCFDLLGNFCEKVFLSVRAEQSELPGRHGLPQIHDTFADMGPLGGTLTALQSNRAVAWLVVACDLPLLDDATLRFLVEHRAPAMHATAFRSTYDGKPEPLCTIYEPSAFAHFVGLMDRGVTCPRKALMQSETLLLDQPFTRALDNANTPQEAQQLQHLLQMRGAIQ